MIKPILFAVSAIFASAMSSDATAYDEFELHCYQNGRLLWAETFSDYRAARNAANTCRKIGGTPVMF